MTTLVNAIKKELSNGTDFAFNQNCVYGMEDGKIVLTVVSKIGEPVKQLIITEDSITNTTGLNEQQLLKLI